MGQEEPPLGRQIHFPAKKPTHRHVLNFPLRSPIRHSGSAGPAVVVAQGRLRELALVPAHSPAGSPSAAGEAAAHADTGSDPAVRCDVPVAAADVVDDKDTRWAEAVECHIHVGQACYFDSKRSRYLLLEAEQRQRDLCSHAHWHCRRMTTVVAVAGSCRFRYFQGVAAVGTDTMGCEMYFPGRMSPVGEVPVEVVEEAGTAAHTPADSYCLQMPVLPAQAAEAEGHTDCTLQRVYRTAHSTHRRRVRMPEHSAVAEGGVGTDRNQ